MTSGLFATQPSHKAVWSATGVSRACGRDWPRMSQRSVLPMLNQLDDTFTEDCSHRDTKASVEHRVCCRVYSCQHVHGAWPTVVSASTRGRRGPRDIDAAKPSDAPR